MNKPKYFFLTASFNKKHNKINIDNFDKSFKPEGDYPYEHTLGFRQIFWRIFSEVYYKIINKKIVFLDFNLLLKNIYIFESTKNKTEIWNTEGNGYFITFCFEHEYNFQSFEKKFQKRRVKNNLNEQTVILKLLDIFKSDEKLNYIFYNYYHTRNFHALGIWSPKNVESVELIRSGAQIFTFFFYCKLIYWRVTRDQVDLNISLNQEEFIQSITQIAKQRMRLTNIHRFFMTKNLTNNEYIKLLCFEIKNNYRIENNYRYHSDINKSLIEHLNTAEKIYQQRKDLLTSRAFKILTYLAIPLTAVNALMTLSYTSDIVTNRQTLLTNPEIQIIISVSFLVPAIFMVIIYIIQRIRVKIRDNKIITFLKEN